MTDVQCSSDNKLSFYDSVDDGFIIHKSNSNSEFHQSLMTVHLPRITENELGNLFESIKLFNYKFNV